MDFALLEARALHARANRVGRFANQQAFISGNEVRAGRLTVEVRAQGVESQLQGPDYGCILCRMATLFEKIVAREIPATIVFQDERVTAFRDIAPQAPVHVLIVPNKPIPTVNDVSDDDERTLGHMFIVARDLAKQEGIAENGFRLIVNCNQHGGQVVYHLHMHLIGGAPLGPMLAGGKHG